MTQLRSPNVCLCIVALCVATCDGDSADGLTVTTDNLLPEFDLPATPTISSNHASTSAGSQERPNDPVNIASGLPSPLPGVYDDLGIADVTDEVRGLVAFPVRQEDALNELIERLYDPSDSRFRQYLTASEWMKDFAPAQEDIDFVGDYLQNAGVRLERLSRNRLLLEFSATVGHLNEIFDVELHLYQRNNPQTGNESVLLYGAEEPLRLPYKVASRIQSVLALDTMPDTSPLPGEAGEIELSQPEHPFLGHTVSEIADIYGFTDMYALGFTGTSTSLGVIAGATFKFKDLQSFWQSMGVVRENPEVIETMEPVSTRYLETTLDTSWAGALAKDARLVVYEGPDARNTSLIYTFNEAIAANEVSVLTTSFAHREDSEARAVREQYDRSARMAAALGITVVSASGDSAEPDVPATSPFVTAVGGTELVPDDESPKGYFEMAWWGSGSGDSLSFAMPAYQQATCGGATTYRATVDLALNASPSSPYWTYYLGAWSKYGGTSYAAPVFAAMIALINDYRSASGLPPVGFINPALYGSTVVQSTFRDIVAGATSYYSAGPGWDYPTGWGSPNAIELADALP